MARSPVADSLTGDVGDGTSMSALLGRRRRNHWPLLPAGEVGPMTSRLMSCEGTRCRELIAASNDRSRDSASS
eukprot:4624838-Prymnesium_polylepis.1